MSNLTAQVTAEKTRGQDIVDRLEVQMAALRDKGLVDCKLKVFSGRDTTTQGVALALENTLKLYLDGKYEVINVD